MSALRILPGSLRRREKVARGGHEGEWVSIWPRLLADRPGGRRVLPATARMRRRLMCRWWVMR